MTIQLGPSPLEYSSVGRDGGCRQRKGAANREGQRSLKFHFYSLHSFSQVCPHETRPHTSQRIRAGVTGVEISSMSMQEGKEACTFYAPHSVPSCTCIVV